MEFREVSRNKKQILPREKCDEILNKATSGVLCVLGDGDYPYGVPISFAYKNNKIYFHGMPSGHKYDSMKRHEKVSLTVNMSFNFRVVGMCMKSIGQSSPGICPQA